MTTMTQNTVTTETRWASGCTDLHSERASVFGGLGTDATYGAGRPVVLGKPRSGAAAGFSAVVASGAAIAERAPGTSASRPPT